MKKIDKFILWFLGLGFPVVVGLLIWAYTQIDQKTLDQLEKTGETVATKNVDGFIWDILGSLLITWLVLAIITLIRLLINSELRETILSKVARIKERDEREVEISGYAAKFTFFANLALLVCLLFFSSINLNLKKYNKDAVDEKGKHKHGLLSMGLGFKAYDDKALILKQESDSKEIIYRGLPISNSGVIILLIAWQLGMFHLSARKKLKLD